MSEKLKQAAKSLVTIWVIGELVIALLGKGVLLLLARKIMVLALAGTLLIGGIAYGAIYALNLLKQKLRRGFWGV